LPAAQVANALSVLAAMQAALPSTVLCSEVVVHKAVRAEVPLSALALKVLRSELAAPVLTQPRALDAASCPAWRANLAAIATLHFYHTHDAITAFAATAACDAEGEAGCEDAGGDEGGTAVARVAAVVAGVHRWWRQPQARAILAAVPEADLWSNFVQHARSGGAGGGAAPQQHLRGMLSSAALAPPAPVKLQQQDVAVFALGARVALGRAGCLAFGGRRPGWLRSALAATPGCAPLRRFLRTRAGRAAYLPVFAEHRGARGFAIRCLARLTLAVRGVRDASLLALEAAALVLHRRALALLRPRRGAAAAAPAGAPPGMRHSRRALTLFDWVAASDPWTLLGTSVAAVLAALRVIVRLTSAFSVAASLGDPARPATSGAAGSGGATTSGAPPPPAPVQTGQGARRAVKKGSKAKPKAQARGSKPHTPCASQPPGSAAGSEPDAPAPQQATSSTASSDIARRVAAAAAQHAPPPVIPAYDPITMRFTAPTARPPPTLAALAADVPTVPPPRAGGATHGDLVWWNPGLAATIRAALPTMLYNPQPYVPGQSDSAEHGSDALSATPHSGNTTAVAQLQLVHDLVKAPPEATKHAKGGSTDGLVLLPSPADASSPRCHDPLIGSADGAGGALTPELSRALSQALTHRSLSGGDVPSHHHQHHPPAPLDLESDDSMSGAPDTLHGHGSPAGSAASVGTGPRRGGVGAPEVALTPAAAEQLHAKLQMYRKDESGGVPELFLCPISRELMENPVLASDGHIYERCQIESWLAHHATSPMTNMAMAAALAPVLSLRSEIQAFKHRFPHLSAP
jgi:U-box domain